MMGRIELMGGGGCQVIIKLNPLEFHLSEILLLLLILLKFMELNFTPSAICYGVMFYWPSLIYCPTTLEIKSLL
jgi:hypothetical protein